MIGGRVYVYIALTERCRTNGQNGHAATRLASAVIALFGTFAFLVAGVMPAGASLRGGGVDVAGGAACTNFYPELCMDASGGIDFGLFDSTDGYLAAVSALARHRDGDDTDGNSIPDSVEIAVCEVAGCLPAWAEDSTPTEPKVLTIQCCDGTFEPDVNSVQVSLPSGFNKKKLVSAFSLSSPHVHYFGAYPASGAVTLSVDGPDLSVGVHRFLVVGTAEGKAEPKVAIWKVEVTKETATAVKAAVVDSSSSNFSSSTASSSTGSARPVVRTGSNLGLIAFTAAALLMAGCGVIALEQRRRDRRYY